ncbi:hypothetical protein D3C72_1379470 [compost metagenome]
MSSDRSLISASTSLTCSCFLLRRRVVGAVANSSVSVTKSIACSRHAKPEASAAVAMPIFSSPEASNSASESKAGGFTPLARRKSSRLSRRPSLSAMSSTRCGVAAMWAFRPTSGSSAPRTTAKGGSLSNSA